MKLAGWKKRIRLDIDYTNKIGGSVTQFPVTIFLKPTNGDTWKVFNEVGNNYRKIAITKADGVTELKVEMELWDVANKVGILHTSLANWVIGGDTSIYLYYDGSHYDNPNVGNIASTAGQAVWDSNFKMVQHLIDYDTSHTKDSTSNNNDGTKKAANEPIEADGKVAKAQYFDGSNDYVNCGNNASLKPNQQITIEALIKPNNITTNRYYEIYRKEDGNDRHLFSFQEYGTILSFGISTGGAYNELDVSIDASNYTDGDWHHVVATYDGNYKKIYTDGTEIGSVAATGAIGTSGSAPALIGSDSGNSEFFNGLIDEVRLSNTSRSSAWIKASYNSLNDTLIKYLKEETLFSRRGIFYVPINTSNFFHFFR